jgi:hypothetical protein
MYFITQLILITALVYVIQVLSHHHHVHFFLPFLTIPKPTSSHPNLSSLGIFRFVPIHPKSKDEKNLYSPSIHCHHVLFNLTYAFTLFLPILTYQPMHPILLIQIQINHSPLLVIMTSSPPSHHRHVLSNSSSHLLTNQPLQAPKSFAFACHHVYTYPLLPIFFPKCFTLG